MTTSVSAIVSWREPVRSMVEICSWLSSATVAAMAFMILP